MRSKLYKHTCYAFGQSYFGPDASPSKCECVAWRPRTSSLLYVCRYVRFSGAFVSLLGPVCGWSVCAWRSRSRRSCSTAELDPISLLGAWPLAVSRLSFV